MAQQPRGKPPSQAPPPVGRGRNALTALGGGVLVLAVAGGAWALFGRDTKKTTTAIGPTVPTSVPHAPVIGPVAPGTPPKAAPTKPTSIGPVAAPTKAAATTPPKATPAAPAVAVVPTKAPVAAPTAVAPTTAPAVKPPVTKPVVKPPVTAPQVGGTVAKKAYTFKIARGDTLWQLAKQTLSDTGRSTSNAEVASYVTKLYQQNRGVVGSDPNLIVPGQTIVWPAGL